MKGTTAGFAVCGSFCTLKEAVPQMGSLREAGWEVIPIFSEAVYSTDTRFGTAKQWQETALALTGHSPIHSIREAEPIGPKKLLDVLVIAPCTGNTLGKLANGITDSAVTMAAKAHLRNGRPVVIAAATNDALSASAKNIGLLLNTKNIYFVPARQDDPIKKPTSVIADFSKIPDTVKLALEGNQIQPILL